MSDGGKPTLFSLDELGARREVAAGTEPARVLCGDMRQVLASLPPESVHAIVTDPPYGLSSGEGATRGFMGKEWDARVPGPEFWAACLRVAKPGAHLLAFGGTRTAHRLACAIEDAGWEVRDCLSWLYGSGFPKSHDVSKAIDREAGAEREVVGTRDVTRDLARNGRRGDEAISPVPVCATQIPVTAPATTAARQWDGWGTALKPAFEIVYLARKPFKGTVAQCVCEHGCGALNIDGCRVNPGELVPGGGNGQGHNGGRYGAGETSGTRAIVQPHSDGRWPANLVLDETAAALLDAEVGELSSGGQNRTTKRPCDRTAFSHGLTQGSASYAGDSGGPSRFYFTASHSEVERWNGLANCAGSSFDLGSQSSVSALADAVAVATHGWALSRASYRAHSTSVTASEFAQLCESVTTLTRCIAQRFSLGLPLQSMSLASDRAKCAAVPEPTGITTITASLSRSDGSAVDVTFSITPPSAEAGASGSVRFNYTAKASRSEREAGLESFEPRNVNDGRDTSIDNPYQRGDTPRLNTHPTVKPISLMRWLVRLITPPGGIVLDPFTGSGSTGVAAVLEGARFIGAELSEEYAQLARARIAHAADEDDGPQLTLFERAELKPPVKAQPSQASFLWSAEEETPP